jgi:hypothetical protein
MEKEIKRLTELGFPGMATSIILDEKVTFHDCMDDLINAKGNCSEEEFPFDEFEEVEKLLIEIFK